MKKQISILLVLVMIVSISAIAFATTYTSSLYMPPNSTLKGDTRSYSGGTHVISGTLSSVVSWDTSKSQTNVYLKKDVFLGEDIQYGSGRLVFYSIGDSSSITSSQVPNGNFYYFFNTSGLSTNAFTCNTVTMTSY